MANNKITKAKKNNVNIYYTFDCSMKNSNNKRKNKDDAKDKSNQKK